MDVNRQETSNTWSLLVSDSVFKCWVRLPSSPIHSQPNSLLEQYTFISLNVRWIKPLIWDTSGELIIAHWAAVTTILNGIDAGLIKAGATAVHYIGILENTQTDTAVSLELFGRFFYEGTVKSSPKFTLLFHNSWWSHSEFSSIIFNHRTSAYRWCFMFHRHGCKEL